MDIKAKMNGRFRDLQGGLFLEVTKADVGEGAGNFMKAGGDIMAWADPFFPDPAIPESVKKAMHEAIDGGFPAHYGMPIGIYELREALAEHISERTGLSIDPSRNVIVTPGSDSGLLYAMMPFISEGDEVMVPDPSYPSNFLNPKLLGGKTVPVPLYPEDNYQVRIEEFEKRLTPRTKMVLLTHPNNPTTTVYRRESIEALCRFIIDNDLVLVCDQAFEDFCYENEMITPAAMDGMFERTVTVFSFSKGMGLSGLRVGYLVCDDEIMDSLYANAVSVLGATNTACQKALIAALEDPSFMQEFERAFDVRRQAAEKILNSIPNVHADLPQSGFLCWVDVSRLGDSSQIVQYLVKHAQVAVNDGKNYGPGGEGHLRIVLGVYRDDAKVIAALERIKAALIQWQEENHV